MVKLGQSFYPTLGLQRAAEQLASAIDMGCQDLFTSLHLPEGTTENWTEMKHLFQIAKRRGIRLCCDVSPSTFRQLEASSANLKPFFELGIFSFRLDYGFSVDEILEISNHPDVTIVMNASDLTETQFHVLLQKGIQVAKLTAIHNYYPRPETGMSLTYYREKNRFYKSYGVRTGGFIPSHTTPRGPMKEGLPSIETHRYAPVSVAVAEMVADGLTDIIYFGDPAPANEDWNTAAGVADGTIPLRVEWAVSPGDEIVQLLRQVHTSRRDYADFVIRSTYSTAYPEPTGVALAPNHTAARPLGTITIDNTNYGRYAGELQITKTDLSSDKRVNVIGRVITEDQPLLPYITPHTRFTFQIS
ncbi:MupG family TIM beta-alpha barrel fold protein [Virgibacillus halophilus]|uniref:MupG family TIM beta-alpha barrel fold protein n=1 Tax=Tigheibacillus halophilus TaxID=361280 RepID=UPI0036328F70